MHKPCSLFFETAEAVTAKFPNLFGGGNLYDSPEEQATEGGEVDENQGAMESDSFTQRWGWTSCVRRVAEISFSNMFHIYTIPAIEFLTLLCFANDYANHEKENLERWRRTH